MMSAAAFCLQGCLQQLQRWDRIVSAARSALHAVNLGCARENGFDSLNVNATDLSVTLILMEATVVRLIFLVTPVFQVISRVRPRKQLPMSLFFQRRDTCLSMKSFALIKMKKYRCLSSVPFASAGKRSGTEACLFYLFASETVFCSPTLRFWCCSAADEESGPGVLQCIEHQKQWIHKVFLEKAPTLEFPKSHNWNFLFSYDTRDANKWSLTWI